MTRTEPLPPLSPTPRSTVRRGRSRAVGDRTELLAVLAEGFVAHVGVVVEGEPVVLPMAYAVDPDGPDEGGSLYLHGSVAARWVRGARGATVCATVTLLDGLVMARSAFHHSMNYRSAVVLGTARPVEDEEERARTLDLVVDHMVPGRSGTLRASTRKELAATAVVAVPLHEASLKVRGGGPVDEPEDVAAGTWAGHLPVRLVGCAPVPDEHSAGEPPADVAARGRTLV